MVRKRSYVRVDGGRSYEGCQYYKYPSSYDRIPTWQIAALVALGMTVLYLTLSWSTPGIGPGGSVNSRLPTCFPLEDKDKVRLLGSQNRLVHHKVATNNAWAQTFFNLGLLALHGFNQLEATNMFQGCLRAEPSCAMCYWGLAIAQGPNPNKVAEQHGVVYPAFLPTHAEEAHSCVQQALKYNEQALGSQLDMQSIKWDKQYIEALAARFDKKAAHAVKSGKWLKHEAKYAERMEELAEKEQDADAYAFAAEAYMNLSPWDYYDSDGSLRDTAATAERLLHNALELQPNHTHALHLHLHIAEAGSPAAKDGKNTVSAPRALNSANVLANLGAQSGHLMHMPSHIYVRVGQYRQAVEANKAAYDFDLIRATQCTIPYLPEHNVQVLVYAASMAGMYHTAQAYATGMRTLRGRVPDNYMAKGSEWVSVPMLYIRYGQWSELLDMSPPPGDARGVTTYGGRQYATVVYHTGRLLALAARAHVIAQQVLGVQDITAFDLARKSLDMREQLVANEQVLLQAAIQAVPTELSTRPGAEPGIYASAYKALADLMGNFAGARLHLLRNNTAAAVQALREAVQVEDTLGYMEPPRVHQPLRQCLGWLLMHTGQYAEAQHIYNEDLEQHPNNGWSLLGLKQLAAARSEAIDVTAAKFQKAWAAAEITIHSSCPAFSAVSIS
eukprot:GHRR01026117.1.p1 GENE.GHRR01026117.1~~GHRR01026117.1.p1  ORF type:complete len:671 (+),score=198.53 GHRR01026117.1:633-2645(+)